MIAVLNALALSGYAVYYFASAESRPWWSTAHRLLGLLLPPPLLLLVHVLTGWRALRREAP